MIKKIIIAIAFVTGLLSCNKTKPAFKYSQDIVAIERSLHAGIDSTEKKVERYMDAGRYDSIVSASTAMESLFQEKIDLINKMPVPQAKGVNEFKGAVMRYFEFLKSKYTAYKKWGAASTEDERTKELESIRVILNNVDAEIGKMQQSQRQYAKLNGFRIKK